MKKIRAQDLARQKPSASCCDCGKEANEAGPEVWTIQGGNARCPRCSRDEGLY